MPRHEFLRYGWSLPAHVGTSLQEHDWNAGEDAPPVGEYSSLGTSLMAAADSGVGSQGDVALNAPAGKLR
jgi:hypothetical protein